MLSRIFRWIEDLPNTAKVLIALVSTIISFVILLRTNFRLGIVVIPAVILVATLSYLSYVVLATNKPAVGFSVRGAGDYKYPRRRRWAIAITCVIFIACILLFIIRPTRYYIIAALKGTELAPQADVLIAEFDDRRASKKYEIPNRIKANLEGELRKRDLREVKAEILPTQLTSTQEAKTAAEQSGSKVVVWGWYDDLGITINFYVPLPPSSGDEALRLKEVAWAQGNDAASDISFKIREQLPDNITFLSLFIIGALNYQNNEYQKGHQAFDAAMGNLPKEIGLENESLLHFFYARSLEAAINPDMERMICQYSKAIELNPNFAAAYNNLGIITTKLLVAHEKQYGKYGSDDDPTFDYPGGSKECLRKIGYEGSGIPEFFFDNALKYQPDSAVIRFNKLAARWMVSSGHSLYDDDVIQTLDEIIRKDPSIPGAHVMRGVIAFDEGEKFTWKKDWEVSREDLTQFAQNLVEGNQLSEQQFQVARWEFSAASRLLPKSSELHVNLGKIYMRKVMYAEARAEFEKALSLAPSNVETHLALADVAIRHRQTDLALQHLDSIKSDRSEDESAVWTAAVLKSRLYFESGNVPAAIGVLQTTLPTDLTESWRHDSLVHYLLGMLYALSSDAAAANAHWEKCDVTDLAKLEPYDDLWSIRDEAYHDNLTGGLAWFDILTVCAFGSQDVAKWGIMSQCLPRDMHQRLMKVYDITQNRVVYRIFYRQNSLFGSLACPYVFTYDEDRSDWRFDTTLIYGLNGKELESSQSRPLRRFNGHLMIREVEPEVSYLDKISVVVLDRLGRIHILQPQLKALQGVDGKYLILRQGDEVHLTFEGFDRIEGAAHFRVEATGYYLPLDRGRQRASSSRPRPRASGSPATSNSSAMK